MPLGLPTPKRTIQTASRRAKTLSLTPERLIASQDPLANSVRLLRKDGLGLKGTIKNIDHHAQEMEKLVVKLAPQIAQLDFKEWTQGHNVHLLETHDGRKFDFVPLKKNGVYTGIEMRLRVSRGSRVMMAQVFDEDGVEDFVELVSRLIQPPAKGHQVINSVGRDCA